MWLAAVLGVRARWCDHKLSDRVLLLLRCLCLHEPRDGRGFYPPCGFPHCPFCIPQDLESRKRAPLYQKKQEEELKAAQVGWVCSERYKALQRNESAFGLYTQACTARAQVVECC
jgi:hypothetical protein